MVMTCNCDDQDCGILRLPPGDRSLAGTVQEGRDFMFAELRHVDLSEADFDWAPFRDAVLEGALTMRCDLRGAVLDRANLQGADLQGANLGLDNIGGRTGLRGADLNGADLRRADIGGADFTGAVIAEADLHGLRGASRIANRETLLLGADPTDARRGGADLKDAPYDADTRFPRGFIAGRAGLAMRGRRAPPESIRDVAQLVGGQGGSFARKSDSFAESLEDERAG
jgi:hypothetical protein